MNFIANTLTLATVNAEQNSLNQDGIICQKPGKWALAGRTVIWFLTFGLVSINASLDKGTQIHLNQANKILKDANALRHLQEQNEFDLFKRSIQNLQKMQIAHGGSGKLQQQTEDLLNTIQKVEELAQVFAVSDTVRVQRTYPFVNDLREKKFATREEFLQHAAIFYPEIEMYKGVTKGSAEFNAAEMERQRTETSLLFIYWIWMHDENAASAEKDAAYQAFIAGQFGKPLSWESFKEIVADYKSAYDTTEKLDYLLATMAVHDLGKVDAIQKLAKGESVEAELHDEILLHMFRTHPEMLASFHRLPMEYQQALIQAWALDYLGPQFMQGENVPASLTKVLEQMQIDPEIAEHFIRHDLCDLAGAMGFGTVNIGKNGCIVLNEITYQAWKKTRDLIRESINSADIDPAHVYKEYLAYRAELLNHSSVEGKVIADDQKLNLNMDTPDDYALTRVACMLRWFSHEEGTMLKQAFDAFKQADSDAYHSLIQELNCSGLDGKTAVLIYYAPALMVNISKTPSLYPDLAAIFKPEMDTVNKAIETAQSRLNAVNAEIANPQDLSKDSSMLQQEKTDAEQAKKDAIELKKQFNIKWQPTFDQQRVDCLITGLKILSEIYQETREHLDNNVADEKPQVFTVQAEDISSMVLVKTANPINFANIQQSVKDHKLKFNAAKKRIIAVA